VLSAGVHLADQFDVTKLQAKLGGFARLYCPIAQTLDLSYHWSIMGNRFNVRLPGARIKHQMGSASIKMYDKFGLILRIEVTVNDITFFKQYREVRHRNGESTMQWAKMKKSIYSLPALQETLLAANRRYLLLKRLHVHGLIKKVSRRYKYYLTELGRQVVAMALKLREMVIIPELARLAVQA